MSAEHEAIRQLRTPSGWYVGDQRAAAVLEEYKAKLIAAEQAEAERLRVQLLEVQAREERE